MQINVPRADGLWDIRLWYVYLYLTMEEKGILFVALTALKILFFCSSSRNSVPDTLDTFQISLFVRILSAEERVSLKTVTGLRIIQSSKDTDYSRERCWGRSF